MPDSRFLVLVLDGLRPDLVNADAMPNLTAFREGASVLSASRAQFPTHTRVNKVSFSSGTTPRFHGVHFNRIYDSGIFPDRLIDLGIHDDVAEADKRAPVITATTVGQALAEAGRSLALVHCGVSGAPWLLNYGCDVSGQQHLSLAGYAHSTSRIAQVVQDQLGDMPRPKGVNLDRSRFAVKAFTEVVYPTLEPDVSVIWFDEPDKSLHIDGLRGPITKAALAHVDALVGEVVAWWRTRCIRDNLNLLVLSDHGHIEKSSPVDLIAKLDDSGLPVTTNPASPGALLLPFGSGGLYLRDQSNDALDDIVSWFQRQPWCGNLFTDNLDGVNGIIPGTFSKVLASLDHPRAPDLLFTLRRMDRGAPGRPYGHCFDISASDVSGSTHGGLHAEEIANVAFSAGPDFKQSHISGSVGGMIDVVPTILRILGIEQPATMTGRPLGDMLVDGSAPIDAEPALETVSAAAGAYVQHLDLRRLERRNVIERGWCG